MNSLMNIREKNKIYHLYVKKHQITGLKYLGYTSAADPHKYRGSGTYWNNHLKAHGAIYDTEILISTDNKEIIAKKSRFRVTSSRRLALLNNNYNKTVKSAIPHYVNLPLSAVFSHPEAIRHESLYGRGAICCYGTR